MPPPPSRGPSVQDQVIANILAQPVGPYTVASYGLPREFLAALADRIICASYQETFRGFPSTDPPSTPLAPAGASPHAELIRPTPSPAARALAALPEERPPLRGFHADGSVPFRLAAGADPIVRQAADLIAARLTADGLIATAAAAIAALPEGARADAGTILQDAGLPIDLLRHFTLEGAQGTDIPRLLAERTAAAPHALGAAARFEYRPTLPGFRIALEDGSEPVGTLRLHITGDSFWGGPGAGSSLEVSSQLARAFPGARLLAAVHSAHADQVLRASAAWAGPDADLRLIVQDAPVSQWAQDNAKGGTGPDGAPACLLPRYASRGEDGSILLPGDTIAGDNLAAAGLAVRRSGLHFQGGNLMCVRDPSGQRLLLVGEAEVHRNTILGLTPQQVLDALRAEFGADRTLTLPSASFHIDFDVTIRGGQPQPTAFVNDTLAGATAVVLAALTAVDAHRVLDPGSLAAARALLTRGRIGEAARSLAPLYAAAGANPQAFQNALSTGAADPGAANLRLLLAALDLLLAHSLGPEGAVDANHRENIGAVSRLERRRADLRRTLERAGFRIFGVPSFSEQRLGLNALNGVHTPGALFMPAWGGLFEPMDTAAEQAFRQALPGLAVQRILSAETQRRAGGPHCGLGLIP